MLVALPADRRRVRMEMLKVKLVTMYRAASWGAPAQSEQHVGDPPLKHVQPVMAGTDLGVR